MIIIVCGLPGSGKSYFAKRLAGRIGAAYVGSDALRNEILASKSYSKEEKYKIYDLMISEGKRLRRQGKVVVMDATFYKEDIRSRIIDHAKKHDDPVKIIKVWADEKLISERVGKPRSDSDADYEVYLKLKDEFEDIQEEHLVLQSGQTNIEELLDKACKYLDEK